MPPTFCRLRAAAPLSCFSFIRIDIKQIDGKGAKKYKTNSNGAKKYSPHTARHLSSVSTTWFWACAADRSPDLDLYKFIFDAHSADFYLWSCGAALFSWFIKLVQSTLSQESCSILGQDGAGLRETPATKQWKILTPGVVTNRRSLLYGPAKGQVNIMMMLLNNVLMRLIHHWIVVVNLQL